MDNLAVTALAPVSLSSGRTVSPGERFNHPVTIHERRLIDAGLLAELDPESLGDLNREQLDARATALGIENLADLKTKADVIEAIEAAEQAATTADDANGEGA
jgi:hypothetical protein